MTPHDLARAFLDKGMEDQALLNKLVEDQDISDYVFGFHVQQALEKYIKAVLAAQETRPTHSHDVGALLDQVREAGSEVPESISEASEWTPYAVTNRYPFFAPGPRIDRRGALELVTQVKEWAEATVG
jgi:HEPN domain-containing protein